MKRLLEKQEQKGKLKTVKPKIEKSKDNIDPKDEDEIQSRQHTIIAENEEDILTKDEMTFEDYKKVLELFTTPSFSQLLTDLSAKKAVIVSLKLGYVDGKYFSIEAISNFLGIEKEEIRKKTTNKLILLIVFFNIYKKIYII